MVSYFLKNKWFTGIVMLLLLSMLLNTPVQTLVAHIRSMPLDNFMLFVTDPLFFISVFFFTAYTFLDNRNFSKETAITILTAVISSIVIGSIIKEVFFLDRPTLEAALTHTTGYGFPSTHTSTCFAILGVLFFEKRKLFWWLLPIGIVISLSRIYVGAHFLSDVIGGLILGISVAFFTTILEQRSRLFVKLINFFERELEARRQIAHLLFGVATVLLLELQLLEKESLLILLLCGIVLSFYTKKKHVPLISRILISFERKNHLTTLPGRGVLFFVCGSLLALFLFPIEVAKAAIIFLAVGDSVTHLIGKYFGSIPIPYNPKKNVEGPLVAWILSAIAMTPFIPLHMAFTAAFFGMLTETLPLRIGKIDIDDNLSLPLVVGTILSLMMHYT